MGVINLEPICAEYGMDLVDKRGENDLADCENIINKALGVLVENGIYAMTVFFMTCNKPKYGDIALKNLVTLLADDKVALLPKKLTMLLADNKVTLRPGEKEKEEIVQLLLAIRSLTTDLHKLLLARKVLEETLTFARYHCKALNNSEDKKS